MEKVSLGEKRHFVGTLILDSYHGYYLERGSVETCFSEDLKTRNDQGAGSLGTPCHSVWMRDGHQRRSEEREGSC
jgi:hypothetical protein